MPSITEVKTVVRSYKTPLVHKAIVLAGTIIGAVVVGTFLNKDVNEGEEVVVIKTVTNPEEDSTDNNTES